MEVEEILEVLEALHIRVETDGEDLELVGPRGALRSSLVEAIRLRKWELIDSLQSRGGWPPESLEAQRQVGHLYGRLLPFVGRAVLTPAGRARLAELHPERAVVAVGCGSTRAVWLPSEVRPPGVRPEVPVAMGSVH